MSGAPKRPGSWAVIDCRAVYPASFGRWRHARERPRLDGAADAEATERVTAFGHSEMPAPTRRARAPARAREPRAHYVAARSRLRGRRFRRRLPGRDRPCLEAMRPCRRSRRRSTPVRRAGVGSAGAFRQRGRVGRCRGPDRPRRVLAQRRAGHPWRARRRQVGAARARGRAGGGMHVLRAGGIEAESELAFAALHQLLRPSSTASGILRSRRRPRLRVRWAFQAIPSTTAS